MSGVIVFNGSAGVTFALPTIVTDSTPVSSHLGMVFELANISASDLTVVTSGSQTFNGVAGKTSLTVAGGAAVRITAVKSAAGTLLWYARAVTLA